MNPTIPQGVEIVLPSGRFARVRQATITDMLACSAFASDAYLMVVRMACRVTLLDDEELPLEALLAMEMREANPIIEAVAKMMSEGAQSRGVA